MKEDKGDGKGIIIPGYDKERDIKPVDQFGFVDLQKANAESVIPSVDGLDESRFNGIDDPNSIAGRPSDVFESMQANKVIAGYQSPSRDGEGNGSGEE